MHFPATVRVIRVHVRVVFPEGCKGPCPYVVAMVEPHDVQSRKAPLIPCKCLEGCCHDVVGPVLAVGGAILILVAIDKVVVEAVFFLGRGGRGILGIIILGPAARLAAPVGRVVGCIAGRLGGLQAARSLLLGGLVAGDLLG